MSSMPDEEAARRRALAVLGGQFGIAEEDVPRFMAERFGARLADSAIAAAGRAWAEGSPLADRDRSLLVLAALVAQGGLDARLRPHVRLALANGVAPDELEAAFAFLAVYVGYPKASVAMEALRDELSTGTSVR